MTNPKRRPLILIVIAFMVACTSLAQNARTPSTLIAFQKHATSFPADFFQGTAATQSSRVETIQSESKLVGKTLPYHVLLPVDYNQPASKSKRYPVLYLLHGLSGHYTNWLDKTRLVEYTAGYDVIIVMPEGNDSWYTDSATVPADKYESYIVQELIPDVEKRFRTSTAREGRAIAGLSMGGYGALKFGVKHPEMFAFAASMSGALDAASWTEADLKGLEFVWKTLQPVYGATGSETRAANDLGKLYRELPAARIAGLPYVYLDCGTEDVLLQSNRSFADILVKQKIPHEYRQLPGNHSWTYWDAQVQEVLRIAVRKFGK
ncbi:MAG TPA: alpha/beta hydrolase family protein [Pyrinomonadaceae bacterium]|nr:alpha/beta hydrolase family protein [Pyrinomonadaceae bacterium]